MARIVVSMSWWAVTRMMRASPHSAFISSMISRPVRSGSIMSRMTTLGMDSWAALSPAPALVAVITL